MTDLILQTLSDEGVLHLELNRPNKKNAFNKDMWAFFSSALTSAQENSAVACVLISSTGEDFSAGMDLNDFNSGDTEEEHPFYQAQRTLCQFDKPLIGAAKGTAVGGGATLLFHCDIIYVGDSLKMRLPFVSLGLVPEFAASYTLQQMIGSRRAAELFYTAEWIDAEKAVFSGIANARIANDKLLAHAQTKAMEIAKWPVNSLQATKQCLKAAHTTGLNNALVIEKANMDKLAGGPENIEAVVAFIEKREADFSQFRK